MPDDSKKKKDDSVSREEILSALRKAVLEHIGDSRDNKSVLKKIESQELSEELKNIGEKLAKRKGFSYKQGTKKTPAIKLTAQELSELKKITGKAGKQASPVTSPPKASQPQAEIKKSSIARQPKKIAPIKKDKKVAKVKQAKPPVIKTPPLKSSADPDHLLKGAALLRTRNLLRAPTWLERIGAHIKWKFVIILIILFLFIIFGGVGIYTIYRTDWENEFLEKIVLTLRLPVAIVNDERILLTDYRDDVKALVRFYNSQQDMGGITIPSFMEIKKNVLERQIRQILVRQSLGSYNQSVTQEEIERQLTELIRASGSRDELAKILNDLYSWSIDEFTTKALIPLLEEEKLTIIVSQNIELNKQKEELIYEISKKLSEGTDFAESAKRYSQDITAARGGDLDWFSEGEMVKEFEDQIFALEVGEISKPFKTIFGWHIVTLTDKDDENEKLRASHILIKNVSLDEYVDQLRNRIAIKNFTGIDLEF